MRVVWNADASRIAVAPVLRPVRGDGSPERSRRMGGARRRRL